MKNNGTERYLLYAFTTQCTGIELQLRWAVAQSCDLLILVNASRLKYSIDGQRALQNHHRKGQESQAPSTISGRKSFM